LNLTPDTDEFDDNVIESVTNDVCSLSDTSNLGEIASIPDDEIEVNLKFTISTNQLKRMKFYYDILCGVNDHSVSQFLHYIFSNFLNSHDRISSSIGKLLFDQKYPRKDVLEKLEKISEHFLECESFPILSRSQIKDGIRSTLGVMDSRTEKKYFKCIIYFVETRTGQPSSYYSQYNLEFFRDRIKSALID